MTWIIDTKSKRRRLAKLAAGFVISGILALGTFAVPANAEWDGNHREHHHNWNGGYYRAPPVVYGSRYHSSTTARHTTIRRWFTALASA
jgi:hypothetical protein